MSSPLSLHSQATRRAPQTGHGTSLVQQDDAATVDVRIKLDRPVELRYDQIGEPHRSPVQRAACDVLRLAFDPDSISLAINLNDAGEWFDLDENNSRQT